MDSSTTARLLNGHLQNSRVGVIDIGSNSVRLVVYDGIKRVPIAVYNDKLFCGLGKGIGRTNRLNPPGVRLARRAIAQLLASARLLRVSELHIIATAAIRDSDDGKTFIKEMERSHHVKIRIISGKKEAQYAAYGIFSSHYKPKGIVGDLGGGSLELVSLGDQDIETRDTLPLGPLRLLEKDTDNRDLIRETSKQQLAQLDWLREGNFPTFYAIGGGFRALAKIHMQETNYPIDLLDHYEVTTKEFLPFLTTIAELDDEKLKILPVSSKRRTLMPASAMVMKEILERSGAQDIVFSTSGIREGLLYSLLSPFIQQEDPLISSCIELAENHGRSPRYGSDLFEWMSPLFPDETEESKRLRLAACVLNELAWNMYRPNRSEWAYHVIMHSSLAGINHVDRISLAAALYHRYKPTFKENWASYKLLDDTQQKWAALVGAAMRTAFFLSGGVPGNLQLSSIKIDRGKPKLRLTKETQPLQGESLNKRVDTLTSAFIAHH